MIIAKNIKWETDGQKVTLPESVELPMGIVDMECCDDPLNCEMNSDSINNYLSDEFGFLVVDYDLITK